jgi:hypothetical protein
VNTLPTNDGYLGRPWHASSHHVRPCLKWPLLAMERGVNGR